MLQALLILLSALAMAPAVANRDDATAPAGSASVVKAMLLVAYLDHPLRGVTLRLPRGLEDTEPAKREPSVAERLLAALRDARGAGPGSEPQRMPISELSPTMKR